MACTSPRKINRNMSSKFRREPRKKEDVKDTKSKVTGNEGKNIRKTSRKQTIDLDHLTTLLSGLNINHLKPTGYVMHHQFNIQQLYALPTLYLCVLYLSKNKQRLVPLTA